MTWSRDSSSVCLCAFRSDKANDKSHKSRLHRAHSSPDEIFSYKPGDRSSTNSINYITLKIMHTILAYTRNRLRQCVLYAIIMKNRVDVVRPFTAIPNAIVTHGYLLAWPTSRYAHIDENDH